MADSAIGQSFSAAGTKLSQYFAVLGALLRFDVESRRQEPVLAILALLEPVVLVGTLTIVVWALNRANSPLNTEPVTFLTTGFYPVYFFMYLAQRMRGSISPHSRRFPAEERLDHIVVHVLTKTVDYGILGVAAFGALYVFLSEDAAPKNFALLLEAMLSCMCLGFGWGIINFVIDLRFKTWHYIVPAVNRHFLIVSGVLFIPDFLGPDVRYILSFNPLMHVVSLFRMGFYPSYPTLLMDKKFLFFSSIAAVACGLILERISRRTHEQ